MTRSGEEATPRPLAAGLLVAFSAPALGLLPVLIWFALGLGEFSIGYLDLASTLFGAFYFGGLQSSVAGVLVGWSIHRSGGVRREDWALLTAMMALIPALLLAATESPARRSGLVYVSDVNIACYLATATVFASLVLRFALLRLGWMLRSDVLLRN